MAERTSGTGGRGGNVRMAVSMLTAVTGLGLFLYQYVETQVEAHRQELVTTRQLLAQGEAALEARVERLEGGLDRIRDRMREHCRDGHPSATAQRDVDWLMMEVFGVGRQQGRPPPRASEDCP